MSNGSGERSDGTEEQRIRMARIHLAQACLVCRNYAWHHFMHPVRLQIPSWPHMTWHHPSCPSVQRVPR
jgi:hypothetical protein